MKRRTFLKGMALTAAGILAPKPGLVDAEEVRRFWALDRTMTNPEAILGFDAAAPGLNYFQRFVWVSPSTYKALPDDISQRIQPYDIVLVKSAYLPNDRLYISDEVPELPDVAEWVSLG